MEFKGIIKGLRFMETNFPEESYTLPSDPPHMNGIEAVCLGADHLIRGGGGYGFSFVIKLFFSTPSLNVQFFSDRIKSKQFFSQR